MLSPKKMKFRKQSKGRIRGTPGAGSHLAFGEFGIMATEAGRITARQIEAGRIAMTRHIKRGGQVWIKVFPHHPVTKKPAEVRMGKGKGSVDKLIYVVKKDEIIIELQLGRFSSFARKLLILGASKLGVRTVVKFKY